jgi:signal transduction histidine kinase
MSTSWKEILLVEDNAGDALLLREVLAQANHADEFKLSHVERLDSAIQRLAQGNVDVVLLDLSLPDGQGLETLTRAHTAAPQVPIVVLTGLDDQGLAVRAVREGAQDYLVKGQMDSCALMRALRYAIERHHLQVELDQARQHQLQMKDQFLSHVSHELRSPLTAIHQYVTILLDNLAGDLKPEQRECLEVALRNVDQLGAMIGDLLEATRADTGKLTVEPRVVSVGQLITDVLNTLKRSAATKGIQLTAEICENLPPIYADADRVRQILINLIDNGIKFTPESGRVTLRARVCDEDAGFLCLDVTDNGCGISPQSTEKIFERFHQEPNAIEMSRKGLGLGLYLCQELVSRHGGRIWVESQLGHGSTFSFTLPVFSLPSLLLPVVTRKDELRDSIALITTEVFLPAYSLTTKRDETLFRECVEVLQRCTLPDLDVLLPRMAAKAGAEMFFIVACTNERGAEILVRRIREQLERNQKLQAAHLEVKVFATTLETSLPPNGRPLKETVEKVAAQISDSIKTIMCERNSLA